MYKKNEQETLIHYDVLTGKTTFYSNYAPDVRRYLQSEGVEITRKIEHDGVVVAVEGELQMDSLSADVHANVLSLAKNINKYFVSE